VPAEKILMNLSYSHIELLIGIEDDFKRTFYEVGVSMELVGKGTKTPELIASTTNGLI
jgi:hypothetical protein